MPGVDILASDAELKRVVQIQVMTKRKGDWHTSKRLANPQRDASQTHKRSRFWVFVHLGEGAASRYWVVPETDVVKIVRQGVATWKQRNPTSQSTHSAIRERSLTGWEEAWSIFEILP